MEEDKRSEESKDRRHLEGERGWGLLVERRKYELQSGRSCRFGVEFGAANLYDRVVIIPKEKYVGKSYQRVGREGQIIGASLSGQGFSSLRWEELALISVFGGGGYKPSISFTRFQL